ncbi:hypothetical protein TWF506_010768 [Arthrobotrys conoides]|uniref:Uncharacterized protein n=1 Tax=Arthrobotrys conoides TaxID=74498 RepID=A0AAN8N237_9PEZI
MTRKGSSVSEWSSPGHLVENKSEKKEFKWKWTLPDSVGPSKNMIWVHTKDLDLDPHGKHSMSRRALKLFDIDTNRAIAIFLNERVELTKRRVFTIIGEAVRDMAQPSKQPCSHPLWPSSSRSD